MPHDSNSFLCFSTVSVAKALAAFLTKMNNNLFIWSDTIIFCHTICTNFQRIHSFLDRFGFHFDRQSMTIPSWPIMHTISIVQLKTKNYILWNLANVTKWANISSCTEAIPIFRFELKNYNLINSMAHVQLSISIRRSIMQNKLLSTEMFTLPLIKRHQMFLQ